MTDVQDSSNDVSSDDDDDDEDKEEDPMEESLVNLYDQRARASSASVMQEADHPRKVGSNGPSPTRRVDKRVVLGTFQRLRECE